MNIDYLTASRYFKIFNEYVINNPGLAESLSPNQMESKLWLIEELEKIVFPYQQFENVEIIGSWYGWPLINLLEKSDIFIKKYTLWDIDASARVISRTYAEIFKMEDRVEVIGKDYWEHERHGSSADLVINTSSEHMSHSFEKMKEYKDPFYDRDPIVVVQSNNMFDVEDHISCVRSVDGLVHQHKFKKVLYMGTQPINDLSNSDFKRYMVIGKL